VRLLDVTPEPGRRAYRRTYTLDDVEVSLGFRWHPRLSGWYLTVYDADGVEVSTGRRLEPGGDLIPDRTAGTLPPGRLVCVGSIDLTRPEYLGTVVQVGYLTLAEVSA